MIMRLTNTDNLAAPPTRPNQLRTNAPDPMHHSASECITFYKKRDVSLAHLNTRAPAQNEPTPGTSTRKNCPNTNAFGSLSLPIKEDSMTRQPPSYLLSLAAGLFASAALLRA